MKQGRIVTAPLSLPSHPTMMTGWYAMTNGARNNLPDGKGPAKAPP